MSNLRATWLNVRWTVPDPGLLVSIVAILLAMELLLRGAPLLTGDEEPALVETARFIQSSIVVGMAFLFGWRRITRTHPAGRDGYGPWLWLTPWSASRPLPLGPVHPALGDAITLAAMYGACAVLYWLGPWAPAIAYLAGQALAAMRITSIARAGWHAYALLLFSAAAAYLLLHVSQAATFAALLAMWLWAHHGLRLSLARFPWDEDDRALDSAQRFARRARDAGHVGWPLDAIGPDHLLVDERPHPPRTWTAWFIEGVVRAMIVAAPLAAWVYVGLSMFDGHGWLRSDAEGWAAIVLLGATAFVCVAMAMPSGGTHRPPISLMGRLATGRLIIPRYNAIWFGPLMMFAAAGLTPRVLADEWSAYPAARYAISVLVIALVWALFRVDTRRWLLTAPGHVMRTQAAKKAAKRGDADIGKAVWALIPTGTAGRPSIRAGDEGD